MKPTFDFEKPIAILMEELEKVKQAQEKPK